MGIGICSSQKKSLTYYTAEAIGVLRYVIASLLFIVIGVFQKIGLPEKKDIPKFLLAGALGFSLYMITFNQASKIADGRNRQCCHRLRTYLDGPVCLDDIQGTNPLAGMGRNHH